jgi:uncharacterized protein YacL
MEALNMSSLWVLRILFLSLCTLAGLAVSQVRPELVGGPTAAILVGFGFGGLLIAIDELIKGFSLRAFSAATFGLVLGTLVALLIDQSGLFIYAEELPVRWLIRLSLFLGFGYIGMILAMRSNKEDFSLIIPYVRFASQSKPEILYLLDTSVIIDGRIAALAGTGFLEGTMVIPRFVLSELHAIADSQDNARRERGRHGLEVLSQLQRHSGVEVRIHESDHAEESSVDGKLIRLARVLGARLLTNDHNLLKIAELQSVRCLNMNELARCLRPVLLPGERLSLKIVREGNQKGQGVGYLNDGTMVVVNNAQHLIGKAADVVVQSLHQTGAGIMIFAELSAATVETPPKVPQQTS